jgi:hypothetical protein
MRKLGRKLLDTFHSRPDWYQASWCWPPSQDFSHVYKLVPSPPNFRDIQIRTPPAFIFETATDADIVPRDMSAGVLIEASTSETLCTSGNQNHHHLQIFVPFADVISLRKVPSSLSNRPQTHSAAGPLSLRNDKLPYFEFLDLFASLNLGRSTSWWPKNPTNSIQANQYFKEDFLIRVRHRQSYPWIPHLLST